MGLSNKDKNIGLPKIESMIAIGTTVSGNILADTGTIRIDGTIEGEKITAPGVILGEKSNVKANIKANTVIISGNIEGNIIAKEKIEIMSTAKIHGNIHSPCISLAEGSIFEGSCKMNKPKPEENTKTVEKNEVTENIS